MFFEITDAGLPNSRPLPNSKRYGSCSWIADIRPGHGFEHKLHVPNSARHRPHNTDQGERSGRGGKVTGGRNPPGCGF